MSDPTTFPPPEPVRSPDRIGAPQGADGPRPSRRLQNRWALFVVTVMVAAAVGVGLGTGIGVTAGASSASNCSPADGWCDLGAVLVGLAFGVVSGIIGYVTTGVIMVVRLRPRGRRAGHIIALIATPPTTILLISILGAVSETFA
jgi:hypothetical protein